VSEFLREVLSIYGEGVDPERTLCPSAWGGEAWEFDPKGYALTNVTVFPLEDDE
jgi:hypothetical protein